MATAKKDYMARQDLNDMIVRQYREGRTVKKIAKDLTHITIDESGGQYQKAMPSK